MIIKSIEMPRKTLFDAKKANPYVMFAAFANLTSNSHSFLAQNNLCMRIYTVTISFGMGLSHNTAHSIAPFLVELN